MNISFSRHSKRRLVLYRIDADDVRKIIERFMENHQLVAGKQIIIDQNFQLKYTFPLKIIFVIEGSDITVITAYPLRKGRT
jgi:hypothetical protein